MGPGADESLPTVVLVMAEHGGVFLWDRSPGGLGDVEPATLGVSAELIARLTDWTERYEEHAARWAWSPPPPEHRADDEREWTAWTREGLHLAYALQHELDALGHRIEVRYSEDGDARPVSERRGP
ncbi:hypothetical protein [Geodermatophilus sp. CPCC 206100]|uniref:hypothetical protein n=1 Tax=Geodermatophilus sp. CPCC 206100 TaxID=3020054 RepID=UPI003B0066CE